MEVARKESDFNLVLAHIEEWHSWLEKLAKEDGVQALHEINQSTLGLIHDLKRMGSENDIAPVVCESIIWQNQMAQCLWGDNDTVRVAYNSISNVALNIGDTWGHSHAEIAMDIATQHASLMLYACESYRAVDDQCYLPTRKTISKHIIKIIQELKHAPVFNRFELEIKLRKEWEQLRQTKPTNGKMSVDEANTALLAEVSRDPSFKDLSADDMGKAIGCSGSLVRKTPFWHALMETSGRGRKTGANKKPREESLTDVIVDGYGEEDPELSRLLRDHASDYEPSPLSEAGENPVFHKN